VKQGTIAALGLALLVLAGCASAPEPTATAAAADPGEMTAANASQVQIETFEDEARCRREAPTGSRISVRTCEKPPAETDPLSDYITRDQVEQIRQQQILQEQARQAREAAERGRAMGGGR
jgi:ABC-type glycerol-3-phosphate transport system substrate-binding protein